MRRRTGTDEAKRAAAKGFSSASGMSGSTKAFHIDILAQVHDNLCCAIKKDKLPRGFMHSLLSAGMQVPDAVQNSAKECVYGDGNELDKQVRFGTARAFAVLAEF